LGINKKILVVDDEAHIRRVVELKLKNSGYRVIIAKNGEEGFNIINAQQPDVVITDIMMPKLDGKALRSRFWLKNHAFLLKRMCLFHHIRMKIPFFPHPKPQSSIG